MTSPAALLIPRLIMLVLLAAMAVMDWRTDVAQRARIEQLEYELQHDILQHRLDAALQIIRAYNGDKAVTLPNGDGSVYIDRLDPGESITFGGVFVPEEPKDK